MKPVVPLLAVVAAVAGAWAYTALRSPPTSPPAPVAREPAVARAAPQRTGPTISDAVQVALDPPPDPERATPSVTRRAAEASFDHIMESLEGMADTQTRLTRQRRDELYRNVNDSFAALSATLDPHSAADMQVLEDAYIRMKAMLTELRIAVPKRRLEPP